MKYKLREEMNEFAQFSDEKRQRERKGQADDI